MASLLYVDSSAARRALIGEMTGRMLCSLTECRTEKEALALLQGQTDIDALVVGHELDDGNGIALIEQLRLLPHRVALPVAFLMEGRNLALAQRALHAGATEVFLHNELEYLEGCLHSWILQHDVPPSEGKVLLVEDSDSEAALMQHLLQVMGLKVHRASRVDAAQALLFEHRFQLAVVDIVLDDTKTGVALLKYLRLNLDSRLPVLMMSGYSDKSRRLSAIKSGADDYLEKPFLVEEFVWRTRRLLQSVMPEGAEKPSLAAENTQISGIGGWNKLSPREVQIARCLLDGQSDKEIAAKLGISYWTVRSHVQHVFDKLGVINRRELMVRYLRTGQ
jgi:DNA-binding NarL/FixJ family response regulator